MALAERTGSRVTVSGAKASNLLGLSTQVPMQNLFWTEGPSRTVRIGNQTVTLKHVCPFPKWLVREPRVRGIVIQAARSGKRESWKFLSTPLQSSFPALLREL